jgi:hypothetical protein
MQEFNSTLKGLSLDVSELQNEGSLYSFVLNGTVENFSEPHPEPYRSNMASNVYCYELSQGDRVVGSIFIPEFSKNILLIYNPATNISKIVEVQVLNKDPYTTDVINCEGASNVEYILSKPQCGSKVIATSNCFKWTQTPKVIYKITDCTLNFYINNGIDEDRILNFDFDSSYNLTVNKDFLQSNNDDCNPVYLTNIDCGKTKWYPIVDYPCIDLEQIPGNKKKGSYSYLFAYSTFSGIPLTSYKALTQPFFIEEDGGGIRIQLSNITENSRYRFVSIVVVETINGVTTYHQKATISVNQKQYIDVDNGGPNISLENLLTEYPFYENSDDMTESNNLLFRTGLNEFEKFNLQPVINDVELEWVTVVAKEGEYKNPKFASEYKSFLRDEVYALACEIILDNGEKGPTFPFVNRATGGASKNYTSGKSVEQLYSNFSCREIYQAGTFGAWESTEVYPNNPIVWGDLCGKPIKHFKFPGIHQTAHQSDNNSYDQLNYIIPLGVRIKSDMNAVFNSAVARGLITQKQRDRITGYKILRGNREGNKSIIAKGLLYDVWKYTRINDRDDNFANSGCNATPESVYHYPNYPYNDLNPDKFLSPSEVHYNAKQHSSTTLQTYDQNRTKFTFHSPETHFAKPLLGNLIKYEAEVYGKARGFFNQSEEFAGYKLMSDRHFQLAKAYGNFISRTITTPTDEALAAQGQKTGNKIGSVVGAVVGTAIAPGAGSIGAGLGGAIGGFVGNLVGTNIGKNTFSSIAYRHSVYLSSVENVIALFKLMSKPQQHHYQHQSVGKYNRISVNTPNQDFNISDKEYLTEGRQTVKDGDGVIYFNNKDRESSVFIKTEQQRPGYTINDNSRVLISENSGGNFEQTINNIADEELFDYRFTSEKGRYRLTVTNCDGSQEIWTIGGISILGQDYPTDKTFFCKLSITVEQINIFGQEKNENKQDEYFLTATTGSCSKCVETFTVKQNFPCKCNNPTERDISSFYVSNKINLLNQYGSIYDVKWVEMTNCSYDFSSPRDCGNVYFGGDTFIGRFSLKRKHNFFVRNTHKLPDETDFNYSMVPNVAYPNYFFDTINEPKYTIFDVTGISFPVVGSSPSVIRKLTNLWKFGLFSANNIGPANYKFDCYDRVNDGTETKKIQLKALSGIIYTYAYGIPSFLVETSINLDLREDKDQPWDKFYPKQSELSTWLQESTVPIKMDNSYHYDRSFSKQPTETFNFIYDVNFKGLQECKTKREQRVIYSAQALNIDDSNYSDGYLVNKALDYYDFSKKGGKVISIEGIEGDRVLVRQENTSYIYNAYLELNANTDTVLLSTGNIFRSKPVQYSSSTNGYFGTQHKDILHTPFGHISVDARRGQVHLLGNGGQGLEEISNQGLRHWYSENLPFQIEKHFPGINIDDNYNGIGISLGYDKKFNQMFITKLDYQPKSNDIKYNYETHKFYLQSSNQEVSLTDKKYFKNKSWTLSYSFYRKEWVSWMSWTPLYYLDGIDTFLTGNDKGAFLHNITNKSYGVFFNKVHPFIVETMSKGRLNQNVVRSITYYADFVRYHNDYDFYYTKDEHFNEAVVYGKNSNSGLLRLEPVSDDYNTRTQYPILLADGSRVELSKKEGQHSFNQFRNKLKRTDTYLPQWLNESNNVNKFLNLSAFSFVGVVSNDYIRDSVIKVRLTYNQDTRHKVIFKGTNIDSELSWR